MIGVIRYKIWRELWVSKSKTLQVVLIKEVQAVEMWGSSAGTMRRATQAESNDDKAAQMWGVPLPTTLYQPQMRAGRWLRPEDEHALVLNQKLAVDAAIEVGDWVTFDHGVKGETTWQVVGLLFDPTMPHSAHVPRDTMLTELGRTGRASTIWIQTNSPDPKNELAIAHYLRTFYQQQQLDLASEGIFRANTASEIATQTVSLFNGLIALLASMAIVVAIVGSIALSGTLSLNVLSRQREIGIMRAIGAPSAAIARLLIGEGLILGWLSWLIALPLSIPAGQLMTQALETVIENELIYHYTPAGALYWLLIITILSVAASWWPARRAMRITVHETWR